MKIINVTPKLFFSEERYKNSRHKKPMLRTVV